MTRVECLDLVGWHADWSTCRWCQGTPPADLEALIVRTSGDLGDVAHMLTLVHCCDCWEQHCPCGGYVSLTDLQALVEAFGDTSDQAWADAMVVAYDGHRDGCDDGCRTPTP
jgi:hypothetical protein